jgi:phytoene desaturase
MLSRSSGTSNTRRASVVGAGPGGLASAMLLAASGMQVTVHERLGAVGGRTRVIENGGYRFDIGATFFLYPDILRGIFAQCGLKMDDFVTLKRVDPQYRLAFEDGPDIYATQDLDRLEQEIAKIDAQDARNVRLFLERGRRKLKAFTPVLRKPFNSLSDYLSPDVLSSLRMLAPLRSVDTDMGSLFRDPRTRLAFSFQTKYLGMSPFRCPSLFTILAFLEFEYGIWHPLGGCGALSEAMAKAARQLGAEIRLGDPVEEIVFEGRTAKGVRTADGVSDADVVVVNADFAANIPKLIPDHLRRRWSDAKIDKTKLSCSTFMLYLGIEGDYPELDHHTIFLSKDYRGNIEAIESGERPPAEPSIYVQNPSRTDPEFGGRDGSSLYVLVPVGHCGATDWVAERQPFRDLVVQRLERLGLKDLGARIRSEKIVTPDDWTSELAIHRGATFNLSHSLDQLLYFRPHNRFEDVDGVYLVGGGTHPGSGLPVIYDGARITSDLILRDLGLESRLTA